MKKIFDKLTDMQLLEFALMTLVAQLLLGVMLILQLFNSHPWPAILIITGLLITSTSSVYYLRQR